MTLATSDLQDRRAPARPSVASSEQPSSARGPIPISSARRAESLRQLGLLSAGVAHDVCNVLNVLSLRIQLLEHADIAVAPEVVQSLAKMRHDIALGVELLGRIRVLGRCELSTPAEWVDLDEVAVEACNLARFHAPAGTLAKTEIRRELGSSPVVHGQRSEFVSAVLNLLLNAIDASPRGGKITVRTGSDRDAAFIEVADEGPGIPAEVQARMFEPYFTTKGGAGTGLGLASVAECARCHHGEVRVTTGPRGTAIAFALPLAAGATT